MSERSYYEILGVEKDADEKALKSAFRKKAMEYHPDRNPGCNVSEGKFKELSEAYETLNDPQKRALYDRFGKAGLNGAGGPGGAQNDQAGNRGQPHDFEVFHFTPFGLDGVVRRTGTSTKQTSGKAKPRPGAGN